MKTLILITRRKLRDVFITNLIDPEIQKEILKQTVEPRQALDLEINMELGMQNHLALDRQIGRSLTWQWPTSLLFKQQWKLAGFPNHRDKCIGKGKTCSDRVLLNHFAEVC